MTTTDLRDRVVLVAGGASGLGAATAVQAAAAGAHVVIADIDGPAATRVADEITHRGGSATTAIGDVTVDRDARAMVDAARAAGPLKGVVYSAAVETRQSAHECSNDDWDRVVTVNVKGAFLVLRHALPAMAAAGGGSVVAFGSTLGMIVSPKYAAYCASKAALTNLCKQAAIEHAGDNIRVNVVAPSATEAGLFMRVSEEAPDPAGLRQMVAANIPMRRLGRADDVTALTTFLLSDASSYISGAVIPLDGGLAARRV
jgi:NAD(P)-dependent dehydrogenase (short-subunit alcohol dehydrogenase family)